MIQSTLNSLRDLPMTPLGSLYSVFISYSVALLVRWLLRKYFYRSPFQGIPGPEPQSWFKGNLGQLFNAKGLPFHQSLVDDYGGMVKVYGFFGDEQLYISDPRALQHIVSKDQDAFEETAVFAETNRVIFGPGLVGSVGEQHKRQRKLVSPIFALNHLKKLMPTFYDIAEKASSPVMEREIISAPQSAHASKPHAVLDMSERMSRVALESVGRTILGYSFDPLDSPYNNPYTSAVKELIPTLFSLSLVRQFAPFLVRLGPAWFRRKLVELVPHKAVQRVKEMSDVMHLKAVEILEERREQIRQNAEGNEDARDIISVLLRANERAAYEERLTDLELTGQMTVLIFGAQDTTSSALSRIIYMLAVQQDVQESLRQEIKAALSIPPSSAETIDTEKMRLTFDQIMKLPLLEAVLRETLRL
ncbi:hypothetical protein AX16_002824 [Volvariella volvacea WC 439]|nr:hypothetical protein AX16_002824 [Volvariella volvacea WC 439]